MTQIVAPLGTFGVSGSILAFDAVNELLRNVHTHISSVPGTPTTTSLTKEVRA
jgi:hypothetical protein